MSSGDRSKYSANVSTDSALRLAEFIEDCENEQDEISTSDENIQKIKNFLDVKFNTTSIVQIQSFCATTNDHSSLSALNVNLATLIKLANRYPQLHQSIKFLVLEIISTHNVKVFYRCLSNEHPGVANPALKLISQIVSFNNGVFVDEFLENFDLTVKSFCDLMYPTKATAKLSKNGKSFLTVRHNMVTFWINLCSNASPLTRMDLLSNNKKINSGWIKYITEFDNNSLIKRTLQFFETKVLNEPSFRKMTKCKLLGDFTIGKFVELYKISDIKDEIHKLLLKITTDEENGLLFHDYRTYFQNVPLACLPSNANFNNNGVSIQIADQKFKINNKIIYNILTSLKPWSDTLHLKLLISILEHVPELNAPYNYHLLHINGTHDPKLTSFYVGQTLLLTKITQLPIPQDFITFTKTFIDQSIGSPPSIGKYYSIKLLMEAICPAQLNRSSLTKGLKAKEPLIRHLTTQLVISVIKKFSKINKLLKINENSIFSSFSQELMKDLINLKLPDPSVFVGLTNEVLKTEKVNKLLLLNYMKTAEYYQNILDINVPLQLGPVSKLIGIDIEDPNSNKEKLSDVDILLFNSYLSLTAMQSISSQHNKWWNVTKGSKNSLFTSIAKLPYDLQYHDENDKEKANIVIDDNLLHKVVEVLSNLVDDQLVFEDFRLKNNNILFSQTWAVVLSFINTFNSLSTENVESISTICKIVDESISRAIKTPYRYYDIVSKISKGSRLSIFYVAVCEQCKFADAKFKPIVHSWIEYLSLFMFLLGEPIDTMKIIAKDYLSIDIEFNLQNYEKFVENHRQLVNEQATTFSMISLTPFKQLKTVVKNLIPKSDAEVIAILDRINTIINSDYELKSVEELLLDLISTYASYVMQRYNGTVLDGINEYEINLLDGKYWNSFFVNEEDLVGSQLRSSKKFFIMSLLREVFLELWGKVMNSSFKKSLTESIEKLVHSINLSETAIKKVSEYIWVLSSEKLVSLLISKENHQFSDALLEVAQSRKVKLETSQIIEYCRISKDVQLKLSNIQSFRGLANGATFDSDQVEELVKLAKESHTKVLYYNILEIVCVQSEAYVKKIVQSLETKFEEISSDIEGYKFLQFLSTKDKTFRKRLYDIAVQKIGLMVGKHAPISVTLNVYLHTISLHMKNEKLDEVVETMIEQLLSLNDVRNVASLIFSPEMTSVILQLYVEEDDKANVKKTWLYRATLYITKVFAESQGEVEIEPFLESLMETFKESFWKYVPKNMLNSQLEVICSRPWINNLKVLKYCTWIVRTGSKNVIECTKVFNILINNSSLVFNQGNDKDEERRYYTSVILYLLINMNVKQLTTYENIMKITKMYKGTNRASDLVLKEVLKLMEIEHGESWIQFVSNWDLIDDWFPVITDGIVEVPELIIDTPGIPGCLTVSLYKGIIDKSVQYFNPANRNVKFPELKNTLITQREDIELLKEFYESKDVDALEINNNVVYDIEFLLLLIINNEDLFKIVDDSVKVNIRALIDTGLLQLVVCGLSHESPDVQEISRRIISSILLTIEFDLKMMELKREGKGPETETGASVSTFKERSAFKVYLGNLLYTLEFKKYVQMEEGVVEPVPKLFFILLSYLVPVLANPSHFLYEKSYRYILSGSKYRDFEIPMYKTIMVNFMKDEHSSHGEKSDDNDYYKELQWMLNALGNSITSNEDLKTLRRNGVFEELLNLLNSPMLNTTTVESILNVFEKIIKLENGADTLNRSFGFLSFVELKKALFEGSKGKLGQEMKNLVIKSIISSDCNGKDKRSREWCEDDFKLIVKRVCK